MSAFTPNNTKTDRYCSAVHPRGQRLTHDEGPSTHSGSSRVGGTVGRSAPRAASGVALGSGMPPARRRGTGDPGGRLVRVQAEGAQGPGRDPDGVPAARAPVRIDTAGEVDTDAVRAEGPPVDPPVPQSGAEGFRGPRAARRVLVRHDGHPGRVRLVAPPALRTRSAHGAERSGHLPARASRPSTYVARTWMSPMRDGSTRCGSSPSTTRSARIPAARAPAASSQRQARAPATV